MRDVSPKPPINIRAIFEYLFAFAKNPVQKISQLPNWDWPSLFAAQLIMSVLSGLLAAILNFNIYTLGYGIILMPIVSTASVLMLSFFLFYYFQFFENRSEDFRKIFTLIALSSLPFYIFQVFSSFFAPISLIGFGFTSLLGVVGLSDNFRVEKKRTLKIVGSIFFLVLFVWISNHIRQS